MKKYLLLLLFIFSFPVFANTESQCRNAYEEAEITTDYSLATTICTDEAKQDNREAQYFLSLMFLYGEGIEQDDAQGLIWLKKSAIQGYADAQGSLGLMYFLSLEVKQAIFWYEKAANQGNTNAQYNLAAIYFYGSSGIKKNRGLAKELFTKACNSGDTSSCEFIREHYSD